MTRTIFQRGSFLGEKEENKIALHAFSRIEQKKKKKKGRMMKEGDSLIYNQNGNKEFTCDIASEES